MGCGTDCGCTATYRNQARDNVYYMRDVLLLMKETNMFSPQELELMGDAVKAYEAQNDLD